MIRTELQLNRFLFPGWIIFLSIVMLAGAIAGINVFIRGLEITNLTDLVVWGLWITVDLSAIALSAGAFMFSAAVYLLGIKKLQPVARTAVYVGLIGYTMAVLTLLLDLGRPDRFWHSMVFWNTHSPLWEVTMCVCLYLVVLTLEVTPIVARSGWLRTRWPGLCARMEGVHRLAPVLAVAGLGLSMLHQSSLGAAYGVLKARPIWYRPGLAVLFIASAMVAGPALTVLASRIASQLSPRARVSDGLLDPVAKFIGWALVAYLYLRFWDILAMSYTYEPARSEGLDMLISGRLAFNFWVGEIVLGILVPMVMLLNNRLRSQRRLQFLAMLLIVGGLIAYRWDITMVGQLVVVGLAPNQLLPRYTQYVPALVETVSAAGVIAYGLMVFTLGARYLGVVDHGSESEIAAPSPVAAKLAVEGGGLTRD